MPDEQPTDDHSDVLAPHGPLPTGGTVRPITRWGTPVMHRAAAAGDVVRRRARDAGGRHGRHDVRRRRRRPGRLPGRRGRGDVRLRLPRRRGRPHRRRRLQPGAHAARGQATASLDDDDEGCLSFPGVVRAVRAPRLGARRRLRARRRAGALRGRRAARPLPAARDRPHPRHRLRRPALGQGPQEARQEARRRRRGLPARPGRPSARERSPRSPARTPASSSGRRCCTNRSKRHRNREFLVQGVRPITRAVEEGWTVRALLRADGTSSAWADDLWASTDAEQRASSPPSCTPGSAARRTAPSWSRSSRCPTTGVAARGLVAPARPDRRLRPADQPRQHRHPGPVGGRLRRLGAGRHRPRGRPLRPAGGPRQHRLALRADRAAGARPRAGGRARARPRLPDRRHRRGGQRARRRRPRRPGRRRRRQRDPRPLLAWRAVCDDVASIPMAGIGVVAQRGGRRVDRARTRRCGSAADGGSARLGRPGHADRRLARSRAWPPPWRRCSRRCPSELVLPLAGYTASQGYYSLIAAIALGDRRLAASAPWSSTGSAPRGASSAICATGRSASR